MSYYWDEPEEEKDLIKIVFGQLPPIYIYLFLFLYIYFLNELNIFLAVCYFICSEMEIDWTNGYSQFDFYSIPHLDLKCSARIKLYQCLRRCFFGRLIRIIWIGLISLFTFWLHISKKRRIAFRPNLINVKMLNIFSMK